MKPSIRRPNANRQLKWIAILLLIILLLTGFRQNPAWVERYYYGGFYRLICRALHPLFNLFPFSVGDGIYLIVIVLLIFGAFRLMRFLFIKQFHPARKLILRFIICLEIAWLWFYIFWGLNYYRPPAAQLLGLNDTSYTIKDVGHITALLIDSANACRSKLDSGDLHQSNSAIYQTAVKAVIQLAGNSVKFRMSSPKLKSSLLSPLLNYMGTAGYYNPFTSESQLNYLMPVFDKPFSACHELSHQTGFAREDEANFAGFIAASGFPDRLLRYSAYYAGVEEFMRYLRRRDTSLHKALRQRISPLVYQDFKADSAYWTRYQGDAAAVSGVLYDRFLKINNQPHGLRTYNRMIVLTMSWYRERYRAW